MRCFKESTFVLTFSTFPNFLQTTDQAWGFIDDRVIKVRRGSLEELYNENLSTLPQWVLITGITKTTWSKGGVDAFISTLGVPLEAEYLWSSWGHALHALVMLEYTS